MVKPELPPPALLEFVERHVGAAEEYAAGDKASAQAVRAILEWVYHDGDRRTER